MERKVTEREMLAVTLRHSVRYSDIQRVLELVSENT